MLLICSQIYQNQNTISSVGWNIVWSKNNKKDFVKLMLVTVVNEIIKLLWEHNLIFLLCIIKVNPINLTNKMNALTDLFNYIFIGNQNIALKLFLSLSFLGKIFHQDIKNYNINLHSKFYKKIKLELKSRLNYSIEYYFMNGQREKSDLLKNTKNLLGQEVEYLSSQYIKFLFDIILFFCLTLSLNFIKPQQNLTFVNLVSTNSFLLMFSIFFISTSWILSYISYHKISVISEDGLNTDLYYRKHYNLQLNKKEIIDKQLNNLSNQINSQEWRFFLHCFQLIFAPYLIHKFLCENKLNFALIVFKIAFNNRIHSYFYSKFNSGMVIPELHQLNRPLVVSINTPQYIFKNKGIYLINSASGKKINEFFMQISGIKKSFCLLNTNIRNFYIGLTCEYKQFEIKLSEFFNSINPNCNKQEIMNCLSKVGLSNSLVKKYGDPFSTNLSTLGTRKKALLSIARALTYSDVFIGYNCFNKMSKKNIEDLLEILKNHFKIIIINKNCLEEKIKEEDYEAYNLQTINI